jgi:prolipoprotein diacylglyceryltransferase
VTSINAFLDALPRSRLRRLEREVPAYRALGIAGFYGAVIATLAGGLLTGRSLLVLAILALVCAVSFFLYAHVRRWIVGQERIVLLEHVWFALAACALVLWSLKEPIAGYLDIVSAGMCVFLAAGRAGCTLVGCCYGRPASVGIVYGESCALDGFPHDMVGVRLFPVPAIEMAGLLLIGLAGMLALPHARPGLVLIWFLAAYSIMRGGWQWPKWRPFSGGQKAVRTTGCASSCSSA